MNIPKGRALGWWKKFGRKVTEPEPIEVPEIPRADVTEPPISIIETTTGGKMKTGTVVWANLDGVNDVLGFFVKHAGDKDIIQVGVENFSLGYREPEDRDSAGAGRTWWKV